MRTLTGLAGLFSSLVLYGIRMVGFHVRKGSIIGALITELALYGIRLLA